MQLLHIKGAPVPLVLSLAVVVVLQPTNATDLRVSHSQSTARSLAFSAGTMAGYLLAQIWTAGLAVK
jgi:hypothetical protein